MAQPELTQERVKFWRDPALQGLDILRARYITHAFSRHSHDGYAIGIIEMGIEEFTYRGMTHRAHAGEMVIVHPGEVHTGQAGDPQGWAYRMLYPEVALMQQAALGLAKQGGVEPYFPVPVLADPVLVGQFRRLHLALELSDSQLERESRFLWFMARLIERHGEARSPGDSRRLLEPAREDGSQMRRIQHYIGEHYREALSLQELGAIAGIPPLTLLRRFQQLTGLPPHCYQVQMRVRQAQRLLGAGVGIAAVAADVGFADQSHLNRHFKRLVGVTPGQYALGCRQGL